MSKPGIDRFLKEYPAALGDGTGAVFIGAGVSMAAGYPSWSQLLKDIGEELGVEAQDIHDLAALAQWSIHESGGETRVRNVIRDEIGKDLQIPEVLQTLARLPTRQIWTTNYDRLIERAFESLSRPLDVISCNADLAIRARSGATRLYKMHGSVDRLDDIVIATDHYELFRSKRAGYLPLLQAHLSSHSMLFVGLSFTDPNIKHVLSLIRECFVDAPPEHFAIVRPPQSGDFDNEQTFRTRQAQHRHWVRDLKRYGLVAVEIENYDEVPALLKRIERRVASKRLWVSGSWPLDLPGPKTAHIHELAEKIGRFSASNGLCLVTGGGLVVGSAALSGFLQSLDPSGTWDLERRLIARPFPQPLPGGQPITSQWSSLRRELARQSGTVIFIGGLKRDGDQIVVADGVLQEYEFAREAGCFLLPIGAFGGAAQEITELLIGSSLPDHGVGSMRPTDGELRQLSDASSTVGTIMNVVMGILNRLNASR